MIKRIYRLPTMVANQIAAGEVIERPASVIKELLENSLDAKANTISIQVGYGGLNQIKVSDDGSGILAEDLPLAVVAHATSKISVLNDLFAIESMGFRGEALASISAISRLTISSKPANQAHAMMLKMHDERFDILPCARSQGTTVDVRDIFYNAPVRKRFLKGEHSEFQAIEMVVKRFALSAPHVAIFLTHNDKIKLKLDAANCDKSSLARLKKLLGKKFIDHAIYLESEHAGMRLRGWLSNSDYQRSQSDQQWIYVNSRMVKDKLLIHALKQAYESILYPGRHPVCVLYLTLKSDEVDVNVHPTKHELRFTDPRSVHDFITSQIQKALQVAPSVVHYSQQPAPCLEPEIWESYPSIQSDREINLLKNSIRSWVTLNEVFVLSFFKEVPYLIDIPKLHRMWLISCLNQHELPLNSRSLLVPVSYAFQERDTEVFESYKAVLLKVGIHIDLAGEKKLVVRSIPDLIPNLEIQAFFAAIFELAMPTLEQIIHLLVCSQTLNAHHALDEEKSTLLAYLYSLPESSALLKGICKVLTLDVCQGFINDF